MSANRWWRRHLVVVLIVPNVFFVDSINSINRPYEPIDRGTRTETVKARLLLTERLATRWYPNKGSGATVPIEAVGRHRPHRPQQRGTEGTEGWEWKLKHMINT